MPETYRVFLSAVSSEFRQAREAVASDLRARGLEVKEQRDFRQGHEPGTTLRLLHDYIADCDAVVAMVGARSGSRPPAEAAAPFAALLPPGVAEASYTQWEVHFALHHKRRLYLYAADPGWQPDDADIPAGDDPALQAAHARWLFDGNLGRNRRGFDSLDKLCREVLREDWPDLRQPKPIHPRFRSIGSLFKGREDAMRQLRESLLRGGRTAVTNKAQAVHGLGGVGKTRLALEYGLAHEADYDALLFASGETPEELRANIAALAGVLGLPEAEAREDEVRLRAALGWLRAHRGWFLVLDNLDTPAALAEAEAMLAHLSTGHAVVTSRLANFSAFFEPLQLDVLSPEAAEAFLLERTADRRDPGPDDATEARAIAEDLGWLALALEQAGAMIARQRLGLAAYRKQWRERRDRLLGWFDPQVVTDYPRAVAVTWRTSVDQVTPAGRALLHRLAFLAPEPVPDWLLDVRSAGEAAPWWRRLLRRRSDGAGTGENLRAALDDLAAFSLVTRSRPGAGREAAFSVHRLVQAVTRQSLGTEAEKARALREALDWVNSAFTGDAQDVRIWPRLDALAPHAAAVAAAADAAGLAENPAMLMGQLGNLLHAKARLAEAEPLLRRAFAIDEASHGNDDPRVAIHLNNLAQLLRAMNRLSEAEPLMRRALAIDEARYGKDHPEVAADLDNLAGVLQAQNRPEEAEPLRRRALAIDEARLGDDHPSVAIRLNNLAVLLQSTNRLTEAEPLWWRALAIDERTRGADHPRVAAQLGNLAQLLRATNRTAEAEALMLRALAIDEAAYGPDHPRVATDLNNLARLLQATGRPGMAEPLMRRAVEILVAATAATGHLHPHLAASFDNYANVLRDLGRTEQEIDAEVARLRAPTLSVLAGR